MEQLAEGMVWLAAEVVAKAGLEAVEEAEVVLGLEQLALKHGHSHGFLELRVG